MTYLYSALLKEPARMPEIDPMKPAMRPMLKIMTRTQQKAVSEFVPPHGVKMHQTAIGEGLSVWIIEPEEAQHIDRALLYLHGGGFYMPAAVSAVSLACEYAMRLGIRVYMPEYRLLPANWGMDALNDCRTCWQYMTEEKKAVYGESAGGALAASLCILLRDEGQPAPNGEILIYPTLDDRQDRYASVMNYEDAVWSANANRYMWQAYLKDASEAERTLLVPMRNTNAEGLPAAYIEAQEFDILRDEAIAYADRLRIAGITVEYNEISGSYHGFDSDLSSPLVQQAIEKRVEAMRRMLG